MSKATVVCVCVLDAKITINTIACLCIHKDREIFDVNFFTTLYYTQYLGLHVYRIYYNAKI